VGFSAALWMTGLLVVVHEETCAAAPRHDGCHSQLGPLTVGGQWPLKCFGTLSFSKYPEYTQSHSFLARLDSYGRCCVCVLNVSSSSRLSLLAEGRPLACGSADCARACAPDVHTFCCSFYCCLCCCLCCCTVSMPDSNLPWPQHSGPPLMGGASVPVPETIRPIL